LILAIIFMTGTTVVFPAAAETQTTAPLVKTGAGAVRGKIKEGVREFLGIRMRRLRQATCDGNRPSHTRVGRANWTRPGRGAGALRRQIFRTRELSDRKIASTSTSTRPILPAPSFR